MQNSEPGEYAEKVPEHSQTLMEAFSGGKTFDAGPYRFYSNGQSLIAIGYPLYGKFDPQEFKKTADKIAQKNNLSACFAIAPQMAPELKGSILETDRFYVLSAHADIPKRLKNPVRRAAEKLTITQSAIFTPAHRRLWAEFLAQNSNRMNDRVAELYAATPKALPKGGGQLRLLDAKDGNGNLVASLLLDHAPKNFISYILGAHSKQFYAPHAADLLFAAMLRLAKEENKRFIHLGLGVNDGILRFKRKWGAVAGLPFQMAQWEISRPEDDRISLTLARAILNAPQVSKAQLLQNEPSERPFAMLWRLEKNNRVSWIGGTAHFFCHSFASSFQSLFKQVDNVIFEGPLDIEFMAKVDAAGKILPKGYTPLLHMLNENEIANLERTVNGPKGKMARIFGLEKPAAADVRWLLANGLPWYAFFTLWTTFLERQGWKQSVDMEAWQIATKMNKNVIGMETLEEQLESLGSLPPQRAINFFRACKTWKQRASRNMSAYLAGDLENMMGSSAEFPTRTEHIVGRRDQRFRERMRPYLEKGRAAVFVGCAHMVNLRHMLAEDGFKVTQAPFGLWPRLHRSWRQWRRPDQGVTW